MNSKYTDDFIVDSARCFTRLSDWRKAEPSIYGQALRRGLLPRIKSFLIVQSTGSIAAYSADELTVIAQRFSSRREWNDYGKKEMAEGKVSSYHCALRLGVSFFKTRAAHLIQHYFWTNEELVEAASHYRHKSDWKRSADLKHSAAYQAALARPDVFKLATAHMTPKASPYSGDYEVYAYEFNDHHAYVGLTFQPHQRHAQHMCRGPVFEHLAICPKVERKILESRIGSPFEVRSSEKSWIERYRADGWTLLNTSVGGGLGTVECEWNKELVLATALKYKTRQEWIDGSQYTYKLAKREGWFEEAAAHMPRRVLGVGAGRTVSVETREKQRQAKVGKNLSEAQRAKISKSLRKFWNPPVTSGISPEVAALADRVLPDALPNTASHEPTETQLCKKD